MKVKDMFRNAMPKKIMDAYLLMHHTLYAGWPIKARVCALDLLREAVRDNITLLGRAAAYEAPEGPKTLFVIEDEPDRWTRRDELQMECFGVSDSEVLEALRGEAAFMSRDGVWPISTYPVDTISLEDLASYEMAVVSLETYGPEVCCAEILYEFLKYGYTQNEREKNIADAQERARKAAEEFIAAEAPEEDWDDEEEVEKLLTESGSDDDEIRYARAMHEFHRQVRDIEIRYMMTTHYANRARMLAMVEEEFKRRQL